VTPQNVIQGGLRCSSDATECYTVWLTLL